MPFVQKYTAQPLKKSPFIGRTEEIQFFKQSILEPESPSHNIVSIYGPAGVGKSTLLSQIIAITQDPHYNSYCSTAIVDKRDADPLLIMDKFATQLQIKGKFRKLLDRYTELLQKQKSEQEDANYKILQKGVDIASSIIKDVPAPILNTFASKGTEFLGDLLISKLSHRHYYKDLKIISNPIDDITKCFIQELNKIADTSQINILRKSKRSKRMLLFFDAFEKTYGTISQWLANYFLSAKISSNIILVFSSRDSIDRLSQSGLSSWLSFFQENNTCFMPIQTFTKSETDQFLVQRGFTRPEVVDTLWQFSKGLPLYLGLITANPNKILDPTRDVIALILDELSEETDARRKLAIDAALLSSPFTQDDICIFDYIEHQEIDKIFNWLITQSFIFSNPLTGKYTYHEVIQDIFRKHKLQATPNEYKQIRQKLLEYYCVVLNSWNVEGSSSQSIDPDQIELILAIIAQHFYIGDKVNLSQAVELIILSYERFQLSNPFISLLENFIQSNSYSGIREEAQEIAGYILGYMYVNDDTKALYNSNTISNFHRLLDLEISPKAKSYVYANLGEIDFTLKRQNDALINYNQAITLNQDESRNYIKRASIYRAQGKLQDALNDINHAIQIKPLVGYYYTRQFIYRNLGSYQEALEDINQVIQIEPSDAGYYLSRAFIHQDLDKYQEALADINQAIYINPAEADYFHFRAHILETLSQIQAALADFNEAIKIKSGVAAHYSCRANTYLLLDQYQKALLDCDVAIQLNPQEADHYMTKASIYENLKQEHHAIDEINKALTLDPNQATFYHRKSHIYMNLRDWSEAITNFEHAIELAPNEAGHFDCLAEVYKELGQYELALSKSYAAIKINPDKPSYYIHRAEIYGSMGDWQNALDSYNQAINLNPIEPIYYSGRSEAHLNMQELSKALEDINMAIEYQSNNAGYYQNRSFIYFCLRNIKNALIDINAAIKLDNSNSRYYNMRGVIYTETGQIKQAFADYNYALQLDPTDEAAKVNKLNLSKRPSKSKKPSRKRKK